MPQSFVPGDFLVFQLEAGFALLRVLAIDDADTEPTWHLAAYNEFFPDVETAEAASAAPERLSLSSQHIALSNRAFESTQVAQIANVPLTETEVEPIDKWRSSQDRTISDRSVRLMLGLR